MKILRGGLWVWVGILVFFLILGLTIGNRETAWQVTEYVVLSVCGLIFLAALIGGLFEMRGRRKAKRGD